MKKTAQKAHEKEQQQQRRRRQRLYNADIFCAHIDTILNAVLSVTASNAYGYYWIKL